MNKLGEKEHSKNRALRQRILQLRSAFSSDEKAKRADRVIHDRISEIWSNSWERILSYVNRSDEVATIPLILKFLQLHKKVCLPAYDAKANRYFPSLIEDFYNETATGRFGIFEPKASALRPWAVEELDVILVPGVAFDRQGNRLGYGFGYFDAICRASKAVKIGLAYHLQVVDGIIPHSGDVPMNWVVTEEEIISCQEL